MNSPSLGWLGIIRLGLVQSAIGAIAVLTTSTLNRVMVVEMALPASLPAGLVAWHYVLQLSRPRWGYGSDTGAKRTPWILGGMGVLALGAVLAADATVAMADRPLFGIALSILAFAMIGGGVAASGTSLLALLATRVAKERRPAAAAIAWVMMIAGIVVTAGIAGQVLDPFSPQRLVLVASGVALIAFLAALLAVHGVESRLASLETAAENAQRVHTASFGETIRQLWRERLAREFTIFVFVSMLAYSAQELILEPYAGLVFGYTLGQSTQLAGLQHGGVLAGMVVIGLSCAILRGDKTAMMRRCTALGCIASAAALVGLASAGFAHDTWPLPAMVFGLGVANGVFAVSALGLMMSFAGASRKSGEGIRVGVWGAAQAAAFGLGGFAGATGLDLMRHLMPSEPPAFAVIFVAQAICFVSAAAIAMRLDRVDTLAPAPDEALGNYPG